jgi:hypothetical protein
MKHDDPWNLRAAFYLGFLLGAVSFAILEAVR